MKRVIWALMMVAMVSSSAGASSGNGWVLWIYESAVPKASPARPFKEWMIYDAYDSLQECNNVKKTYLEASLEEALKEKKDGKIESSERRGNSIVKKMLKDNPATISERETYYCLPGTLDPREKEVTQPR